MNNLRDLFQAMSIVVTGASAISFLMVTMWPFAADNLDWSGFWMVLGIDLVVIFDHLLTNKKVKE